MYAQISDENVHLQNLNPKPVFAGLNRVHYYTVALLNAIISLAKQEISVRQSWDVWNANGVKRSITWECKPSHTDLF